MISIMYAGIERAVGNMDVARHDDIVAAIQSGEPTAAFTAVQAQLDGQLHVSVA